MERQSSTTPRVLHALSLACVSDVQEMDTFGFSNVCEHKLTGLFPPTDLKETEENEPVPCRIRLTLLDEFL
jgi:hypothetical protein